MVAGQPATVSFSSEWNVAAGVARSVNLYQSTSGRVYAVQTIAWSRELTRDIGWACDLHIFERTRSRIIESTRPLSPFFQYERHIDLAVPVFAAAAGLAVLSTWTDRAVSALVDEIGEDPKWGLSRSGMTRRALSKMLQEARADGYAGRSSLFHGEIDHSDRLHAIARPVFRGEQAIGGLVVLWPKGFMSTERFAKEYLDRFGEAAAAITADLRR